MNHLGKTYQEVYCSLKSNHMNYFNNVYDWRGNYLTELT